MSESILERLRYYARVDPRNTVSVFPGDVIEAIDELLRGLSIGRILDMMKAAPCCEHGFNGSCPVCDACQTPPPGGEERNYAKQR